MTKTAEKVGFIFATFALLSGEIQALTLTLDTVSALARGLKMLRPFVACPSSLEAGSNLRILTEGLEGRTAMATSSDVSSLMRLGSSRLLEGQDLIVCLEDFGSPDFEGISSLFIRLLETSSQNAVKASWVIAGGSSNISDLLSSLSGVRVDQRVYFLSQSDFGTRNQEIEEGYVINGRIVRRTVGKIDGTNFINLTSDGFLSRRASNLQGQTLRAMVDRQAPNLFFGTGEQEVVVRKGSEGDWKPFPVTGDLARDMTGHPNMQGSFLDLVLNLERDMNFTTKFYLRQDGIWGYIINGSWAGMIRSVMKGDADFICASLTLTTLRQTVVDYLHPIGTETMAMFIKREGLEEYSWLTFSRPFRNDLWYVLLINAIFVLAAVKILQAYYSSGTMWDWSSKLEILSEWLGDFWMVGGAYFGRAPSAQTERSWTALYFFMLVVFLCGNLVFMCYKASLTAELAVRRERLPFNRLEHLMESDYRVIALSNAGLWITLFENANENSAMNRLYKKIIEPYKNKYIFETMDSALENLMVTPRRALLTNAEQIHTFSEYKCQLTIPWQTRYPRFLSYGFPKRSPYYALFNFALMRKQESGVVGVIMERWRKGPVCEGGDGAAAASSREPEDVALGMKKVVSVFAWLAAGFVLAAAMLAAEAAYSAFVSGGGKPNIIFNKSLTPRASTGGDLAWKPLYPPSLEMRLSAFLLRWGVRERTAFLEEVEAICRDRAGQILSERSMDNSRRPSKLVGKEKSGVGGRDVMKMSDLVYVPRLEVEENVDI